MSKVLSILVAALFAVGATTSVYAQTKDDKAKKEMKKGEDTKKSEGKKGEPKSEPKKEMKKGEETKK